MLCEVVTARSQGRKLATAPTAFIRGELILRRRTGPDGRERVIAWLLDANTQTLLDPLTQARVTEITSRTMTITGMEEHARAKKAEPVYYRQTWWVRLLAA